MKIQSRVINRGDKNESSWPSINPKGERGVFVFREGKCERYSRKRVEQKTPYIISDEMQRTLHPSDGKTIVDSKSKFKRIARAHGHDIRTGADKVADNKPKFKESETQHYERDVKIAWEMVQSGTAPLTDYDKHICKEINERLKNRV